MSAFASMRASCPTRVRRDVLDSEGLETRKRLMSASVLQPKRRFQLVMIKPSHYGEDGYVIRWWRATIPSNSLASLYGIAQESLARRVLGPDVEIDIEAIDEFSARVDIPKLVARFSRHDNFGLIM